MFAVEIIMEVRKDILQYMCKCCVHAGGHNTYWPQIYAK